MRRIAIGLLALALPALAAAEEEARPRIDPKDLEVQVRFLADPVPAFRERAARKIGDWGTRAKSAVPSLLPLLHDPEAGVRRAAAFALSRMEAEAAPAADRLVGLLGDDDPGVRANAALAVEAAGGGRGDRAALAKALKDPDRHVRANAAAALGGIGAAESSTLAALGAALKDEDAAVRCNAAWALGIPKEKARAAVPALCRALADEVEVVRAMAARGLGRIGEDDRASVAALLKSLKEEAERAAAAKPAEAKPQARPPSGPPEVAADAELRVRLAEQGGVRRNAAWALGRFRANSKDAKSLLEKVRDSDPNATVRAAAKTALERTDGTTLPAALEEEPREFPRAAGLPWRMAVVGQSLEVVFRYEK